VTRHRKPTQARTRRRHLERKEAPMIHLSNLASPMQGRQADARRFQDQADGKKVRVAKSRGAEIDG
jgi:large subunit ribosomal protein L24